MAYNECEEYLEDELDEEYLEEEDEEEEEPEVYDYVEAIERKGSTFDTSSRLLNRSARGT